MSRSTSVWCAMMKAVFGAILFASFASRADAQIVRGTVVDGAGNAIPGVVVALIDSTQTAVARSLTSERGEYRLVAPRAGTYRLRTLRIGYQPVVSTPRVVDASAVIDAGLVLDGVRTTLSTVRVVEQSVCGRQDGGGSTLSAWDQAMTSIAATSLTSSMRGLTATTMQIERQLEPNARRIVSQQLTVRTDYVTQPWRSLSPDALRKNGYTAVDVENFTTYYAPGLDVLMSPRFLEDHCVRVVGARDTTEIGVAFEPVPARARLSEIRGTLWLARETAELKRLDFSFTETQSADRTIVAGGAMTFTRLESGAMVISAWDIRMPELVKDSPRSTKVRVARIASSGGNLVVLRRANDTLFKRAPLNIAGVVLDSVSNAPIARAIVALVGTTSSVVTDDNGRFSVRDVLPGEYALSVRTPSLDSVRTSSQSTVIAIDDMPSLTIRVPTATQLAATLCGATLTGASGRGKGAVLGTVLGVSDTIGLRGVRVAADWTELVARTSGSLSITPVSRRLETRTGATGGYRLCGVPTEVSITIRALPDTGRAQSVSVRLAPDQQFSTQTLRVDRDRAAVAMFAGTVVADSTMRVLADVEVAIPSLGLSTRSNARGEFRLLDVPAGAHEVFVRRVGFGAINVPMTFAANDEELRRIVLRPLTVLDSIEVRATRLDMGMVEFEENRRVGLGHFLTRDMLAKNDGRKMGDVLAELPGAGVVRGRSGAWPLSKRYVVPLAAAIGQPGGGDGSIWRPTAAERNRGMIAGCYALVYVDNHLMNGGTPTEPYDVNSIAPDQIEGVEWYASPAETPSQYTKLNSPCGVLVIHTRRFDSIEKGKTP